MKQQWLSSFYSCRCMHQARITFENVSWSMYNTWLISSDHQKSLWEIHSSHQWKNFTLYLHQFKRGTQIRIFHVLGRVFGLWQPDLLHVPERILLYFRMHQVVAIHDVVHQLKRHIQFYPWNFWLVNFQIKLNYTFLKHWK